MLCVAAVPALRRLPGSQRRALRVEAERAHGALSSRANQETSLWAGKYLFPAQRSLMYSNTRTVLRLTSIELCWEGGHYLTQPHPAPLSSQIPHIRDYGLQS